MYLNSLRSGIVSKRSSTPSIVRSAKAGVACGAAHQAYEHGTVVHYEGGNPEHLQLADGVLMGPPYLPHGSP